MKSVNLTCRFCHTRLSHTILDLGMSPVANNYISLSEKSESETFYPLHIDVCTNCWLVQLPQYVSKEKLFSGNYAYFSSYSTSWLTHAQKYVGMMIKKNRFDKNKLVIEIASNDGYLLQYFKKAGVRILGIEPAKNTAAVAKKKGIPTITKFFGMQTARELVNRSLKADLLIGNNVLAHVPDLNDFVAGMKIILRPKGIITLEFPHLLQLIRGNQFDTIYHEHFSYFSFLTVNKVFTSHGLTLFDVEEIPTHGGSLRIYGRHFENGEHPLTERVDRLLRKEIAFGINSLETYRRFAENVKNTKRSFLSFLIDAKNRGKTIAGFGAPAKGTTFLNYCGIRTDFLDYTVDANPNKQNHFLPGVRIPVFSPQKIRQTKPDFVVILPWNIKSEIMEKLRFIQKWRGKFVTAIPKITIQ